MELAYRTHGPGLVRLAVLMSGSRELAEDVVHTVFAEVQPRWGRIDDPPAYLRRAVANRVRDAQRRSFRARAVPIVSDVVVGEPSLDETWRLVVRLPARQREVLVLHIYEDLSLVDIADLLDRRPATVRSDLRRALARLRKELT